MSNYEIYRKHKVEIFNMACDIIKGCPLPDDLLTFWFGTPTQEQQEEYYKKVNEYFKNKKPEVEEKLKEFGFRKE